MLVATDPSLPFKQTLHWKQWSEKLQLASICTSTIQFLVSVLAVQVSKIHKDIFKSSNNYSKCIEIVQFNLPQFHILPPLARKMGHIYSEF